MDRLPLLVTAVAATGRGGAVRLHRARRAGRGRAAPDGRRGDDVALGRVCTGQARRFRLAWPGSDLTVHPLAGSCPDGPSLPTTGTVELTFAR